MKILCKINIHKWQSVIDMYTRKCLRCGIGESDMGDYTTVYTPDEIRALENLNKYIDEFTDETDVKETYNNDDEILWSVGIRKEVKTENGRR